MNKVIGAVSRYLRQTDRTLLLFSLLASAYGMVLVYSATLSAKSGSFLMRTVLVQGAAVLIGLVAMIVLSKIDYHTMGNVWKFVAAAGVLLLTATLVLGKSTNTGSLDQSWITFGSMSLQPAEIVKVMFILTFAKQYDMVKDNLSPLNVALLCLHAAVPIGLILITQDMGMVLVYTLLFLGMLFASGVKLRYFAGGGIALLLATPLIWEKLFKAGGTQRNRIMALLDPTNPLYSKDTYQQKQAVSAIGSGEIWGYGLFKGPKTQSPASYVLPEKRNDMIFAVTGEELGLIGCLAVFLIFVVLLARFLIVAAHAKDGFGSMICVGVFCSFAVQVGINIGVVLQLLPVIGITLPFFSQGGTSTVSAFLALGLVLSVHMHRKELMFADQDG